MKTCSACKVEKPVTEFGKNRTEKDGLLRQCKACNRERALTHYRNNRGDYTRRIRERRFKYHGITKDLYEEVLREQGGGCAVCGRSDVPLVIDHDHDHCSGTYGCAICFRGVLCNLCNRGLGYFQDSADKIGRAYKYLDTWRNR